MVCSLHAAGRRTALLALLAYQVAYFLAVPPMLERQLQPDTTAAAIFE